MGSSICCPRIMNCIDRIKNNKCKHPRNDVDQILNRYMKLIEEEKAGGEGEGGMTNINDDNN